MTTNEINKTIKNRVIGSEKIAWKKLKPFQPENLKVMTDESFERLKNSIKDNSFTAAFDVWKENDDLWILDGHHRKFALEALEKEGYQIPETFQCTIIDCKDKQDACYVLASKASSHAKMDELGFSEWVTLNNLDFERLQATLDIPGIDIEKIWNDNVEVLESQCDEDEVPDLKIEATSKLGDVWILGDHRLMCGDSTSIDDVEKLMNGEKADMVFTDPPYNVDYEGYTDKKLKIEKDNMSDDEFKKFLSDVFGSYFAVMKPTASMYVCHGSVYQREFQNALEQNSFDVRCQIIWAKNTFAWGFARYKFRHEPIFYCHIKGKSDSWYGDKTQSTLWEVKKPSANKLHPTMKPIELIDIALANSSKIGNIVLDLFGGSGSTLIAAAKNQRIARTMEIDPRYCDVIVNRWQKYTGKTAIHEETNKTFDELSPLV